MDSNIRIYVSAVEHENFSASARILLQMLSQLGYELVWISNQVDYDQRLDEIERCSALLAVVDSAWQCSTQMAIETCHALGNASWEDRRNSNPIPVFIYSTLEREKWGWLEREFMHHPDEMIILDTDTKTALSTIKSKYTDNNQPVTIQRG